MKKITIFIFMLFSLCGGASDETVNQVEATSTSITTSTTSTPSTTTSTSSTTTSTSSTTTTLYTRGEIDVKFFDSNAEGFIAGERIQIAIKSSGRNAILSNVEGIVGGNFKINISVSESGIISGTVNNVRLEIDLFSSFGNIQGNAGFIPVGLEHNSFFGTLSNVGGQTVNLSLNENGVTGFGSIYSLIVAIAINYFF
jgi:hypothetical protein